MCDTFVALPGHTADGSIIFGKNSDRDPNEAQALEWHPAQDHPAGAELKCTYLSIPQARHTHGVLLSRPHWMWGAEMGANDLGVVIGNEAVFTRRKRSREPGLIGMDLLRLALERANTAREALDASPTFSRGYGQGGLHSAKLVYHNSYLIADPEGAWVLETAGEFWAAKRVKGYAAISNGLTLGTDFDESSPGLPDAARKLGLLRRGEDFDFARCFADPFYRIFTGCRPRRSRALDAARSTRGQDGYVGRVRPAARPRRGGSGVSARRSLPDESTVLARGECAGQGRGPVDRKPCRVHQGIGLGPSGRPEPRPPARACSSRYGSMAPCCRTSVRHRAAFDDASLWWRHELVHRTALRDLPRALEMLVPDRDAEERQLLDRARAAGAASASERFALTEGAFRRGRELDESMLARFEGELRRKTKLPLYGSYWRKKNRQAGIRAAV